MTETLDFCERSVIETRLSEWRRLLRASTTQGRTVLQRILRGRITFTPHVNEISGDVDGYDFSAPTRFDRLFTGIAVQTPSWLDAGDRTGREGIGPEDTFDGDYGRLLEQAAIRVKVGTSPAGSGGTWNGEPSDDGEWTALDAWMAAETRTSLTTHASQLNHS